MTPQTDPTRAAARPSRGEVLCWLALAVAWSASFLVSWLGGPEPVERTIKGLLMPVLLACALAALGRDTPRWLVAGLVFATIGDIAIDIRFEAGLAGFLVMQICYVVGFLRLGAAGRLRTRWPVTTAYAALWVGINVALGPSLGDLRLPILVYSAVICLMAALGAGVSIRVGLGAWLFVISDALIALGEAGADFAIRDALVMPTYLVGQYLIVTGWVRRVRPQAWLPI